MEALAAAMKSILNHVKEVSSSLDGEQVKKLVSDVESVRKVFVYGAGRSGLVAKAFAIRLMHLGINVFVIGEIITPAIEEGDLVIIISGSGETTSAVNAGKIARKVKAKVVLITSYPNSSLGKIADYSVVVKGRTKLEGEKDFLLRQIKGEHYSTAPLGTLFEISSLVFLDSLIAVLMARLKKSEEFMRKRHATIE